jgi:alkylated DNA repair dioxygenase AlkB
MTPGSYGVQTPITPAVERLRRLVVERTGVEYNHAVVLLYRGGGDCIGFHHDKTLDLDETAPIASISLGVARRCVVRQYTVVKQ